MYRPKPAAARITKDLQTLSISQPQPKQPSSSRKHYDINLVANYFEIELGKAKSGSLFLYTIGVQPDTIKPRLRRRAIYCWLQAHDLRVEYATNYHNFLLTDTKIADCEDLQNFEFWDEHETGPRQNHAPRCRITIRNPKEINIPNFLAELNLGNTSADPDQKADMLISMNMIFSQRMNEMSFRVPEQTLRVAASGPSKFFRLTTPTNLDFLGRGKNHSRGLLVAQRGFVRSSFSSTKLLLNVNNATGVFYRPGPLSQLINDFIGSSSTWPRSDLSGFLRGLRGRANHLSSSNGRPEKIYTISRVARPVGPTQNQKPIPSRIFFNLRGTNTSVGTYYAHDHPSTRVNDQSNCIVVQCGPDIHPIYLPCTVFDVLPGQPFKKPLSTEQLADFITHSCRGPVENRDNITGLGLELFGIKPAAQDGPNAKFGISLQQQMVRVSGCVLFPPIVRYAGQTAVDEKALATGGWNLINQKFALPAEKPSTWSFLQLWFADDGKQVKPEDLLWNATQLQEAMPRYGIAGHDMLTLPPPEKHNHSLKLEGSIDSWDFGKDAGNQDALRERLKYFQDKKVKLVLITLPAKRTNVYAMVKRAADVHIGIHTICAVAGWQRSNEGNFWCIKYSPQFLGNILLKYNLKLGGVNHRLYQAQHAILSKTTMIVGMDVTHPPPGSQNGAPSIAAVVATEDTTNYVNWPVSLRLQRPPEDKMSRELIDDLKSMFSDRLKHWMKKNQGSLPEQIIIYRDGVSDGFYNLVKEHEFPKLKQAITDAGKDYSPSIVYFIVLKRHSTRFFPSPERDVTNGNLLDLNGNPKPGLLIRDTLTRRSEFGYFLQSHECLKGTARPAHYLLKVNMTKHEPLTLMTLTHDFCYLFSRATCSVHIHPAVFYADLACTRARHYLRQVYNPNQPGEEYNENHWLPNNLYKPHPGLQDRMFYI